MIRFTRTILLFCICLSCKEGSAIMPLPQPVQTAIITTCSGNILLETADKTSTLIKFTSTKNWTITLANHELSNSWISLNQTAGESGAIEVIAVISEANPSSFSQRIADITVVSDTAFRLVSIIQPPRQNTDIAVTSVLLNKNNLHLVTGDSETLTITFIPDNATNRHAIWSSSDDDIATVSQTGMVSAISCGTTNITATTVDAERVATCKVTVVTIPENGGQINEWN